MRGWHPLTGISACAMKARYGVEAMTIRSTIAMIAAAGLLAGCGASLPGMSTGSLFGGKEQPKVATNDPLSRAMQVGSTSARALKCGYNFDPVKLRTQYLASEAAAGPADTTKIAEIYDTSFNGISKAVVGQSNEYCSPEKTRTIREALNRHLAGDYTPTPPPPEQVEDSLFGDWGSGGSGSSKPPASSSALPTANPF